jgi:hypothetical protein
MGAENHQYQEKSESVKDNKKGWEWISGSRFRKLPAND